MPAGIASLCVKQWREDKENEEITYDLATDEGVTAALGKNFKWSVNGKANTNVKGERKTGQLFLKDAINSLRLLSRKTKLILIIMSFLELMRQERHMRQMYWGNSCCTASRPADHNI